MPIAEPMRDRQTTSSQKTTFLTENPRNRRNNEKTGNCLHLPARFPGRGQAPAGKPAGKCKQFRVFFPFPRFPRFKVRNVVFGVCLGFLKWVSNCSYNLLGRGADPGSAASTRGHQPTGQITASHSPQCEATALNFIQSC